MKFFFNSNGFSLIEAIAGIAILGIIFTGGMSLVKLKNESKGLIEQKIKINDHFSSVRNYIRQPEICAHNFVGLTISKTTTNSLTNLILPSGISFSNTDHIQGVVVDSITIEHTANLSYDSHNLYKLNISYKDFNGNLINKSFKIALKETPAEEIISCGVKANEETLLARELNCQDLGGTFTLGNCHFNGIKLGYKTACDVSSEGTLRYDSTSGCPEVCDHTLSWTPVCGVPSFAAQCLADGGTIYNASGTDICRFNASSCPSGWNFAGWTTTSPGTLSTTFSSTTCSYPVAPCKGHSPDSYTIPAASETLTTGSHSWSTTPVETESCKVPTCDTNGYRRNHCDNPSWEYSSTIVEALDFSDLCGTPSASTTRKVIMIKPISSTYSQHGAQSQHFTTTKTVSATITQIGCTK